MFSKLDFTNYAPVKLLNFLACRPELQPRSQEKRCGTSLGNLPTQYR